MARENRLWASLVFLPLKMSSVQACAKLAITALR